MLSQDDARRVAIRAQLLTGDRPTDVVTTVHGFTLLQVDLTNAVAPSAELVLWSRLGSSFRPEQLHEAVERGDLVEHRGMVRSRADFSLYRAEMQQWADGSTLTGWRRSTRDWLTANDRCRRDILDHLALAGPLPAKEIPDTCVQPWKSSGWNNQRNVSLMLGVMERCGDVAVAGREGNVPLYDLADRVQPDVPVVPLEEAARRRDERRLRSLGIARAKATEQPGEPIHVGATGVEAAVDGVKGTWRVDPELLDRPFGGRTALLSPLDRLVFDRKRTAELLDFDYLLEMYKPADQRMWGYWALPILSGDRLVGKADLTADRRDGVLRVNAIHRDVEFTKVMERGLDTELDDLAAWLALTLVR